MIQSYPGKPQHRIGWVKISAIAASIAFLVAISSFWINLWEERDVEWKTLTAESGQRQEVQLPDGSVVHLNSESSLSYPENFSDDTREVRLTGEAFFEVTKDPDKPFLVDTENVRTTVLGTSFNVQAYPAENVVVTVATGKVKVGAVSEKDHTKPVSAILTPGLQATYDVTSKELTTATVSPEIYSDWKNNIIRFHNTSLGEVAKTLSKWYGITITFEQDEIKHCRISGQFKNPELKDVLESIRYMYPIQYKFTDPNKILLYGKGC
jgi:ferric-dicitrate binding protein FerR (iron transport regulator)